MIYNIDTLTEDDVRQMLANGDDNHDNQIRVTIDGEVYLSQDIVGNEDIEELSFRLNTFDARCDFVGTRAADDANLVNMIYTRLKGNWPQPKGPYIDLW